MSDLLDLLGIADAEPAVRKTTVREHERTVTKPRSRRTDPETSRIAAASVNTAAVEARILDAYRLFGWLNADECVNVIDECHPPTVRSAVTRLKKSGQLIDTGTKRPSNRGRPSTVLKLAPSSETRNTR